VELFIHVFQSRGALRGEENGSGWKENGEREGKKEINFPNIFNAA